MATAALWRGSSSRKEGGTDGAEGRAAAAAAAFARCVGALSGRVARLGLLCPCSATGAGSQAAPAAPAPAGTRPGCHEALPPHAAAPAPAGAPAPAAAPRPAAGQGGGRAGGKGQREWSGMEALSYAVASAARKLLRPGHTACSVTMLRSASQHSAAHLGQLYLGQCCPTPSGAAQRSTSCGLTAQRSAPLQPVSRTSAAGSAAL